MKARLESRVSLPDFRIVVLQKPLAEQGPIRSFKGDPSKSPSHLSLYSAAYAPKRPEEEKDRRGSHIGRLVLVYVAWVVGGL